MKHFIYADNAATTKLDKDAFNASFGQVLYCPYDYDKVRLIVKKMTN